MKAKQQSGGKQAVKPKAKVAKAKAAKVKPKPKPKPAKSAKPAKPAKPAKLAKTKAKAPAAPPPIQVRIDDRGNIVSQATPVLPVRPVPPMAPVTASPVVARIVPPGPRNEAEADRDVGRLLRHGERFGELRLEIRNEAAPFVTTSGQLVLADLDGKLGKPLARGLLDGRYRTTLTMVHDGALVSLAAIALHVGRPPIARWVMATEAPLVAARALALVDRDAASGWPQLAPELQRGLGAAPVARMTSGGGATLLGWAGPKLAARAYWGLDGNGGPVCLLVDVGLIGAKAWKAKPVSR